MFKHVVFTVCFWSGYESNRSTFRLSEAQDGGLIVNSTHAYFNQAANLLKYFDKLLKKKKVTLNRLTNCINRSKFLSVG